MKRLSIRKYLLLISMSLIVGLGLIACGGGSTSKTPAPETKGVTFTAEAVTDTSIKITFSEAMTQEAANSVNYSISPALEVKDASLSDDALVATLNTTVQSLVDYTVTTSNLVAVGGEVVETATKGTFKGIDTEPQVTSITATSPTTVQIVFSEPVSDSAADASNYVITTEGGGLAVIGATLNEFKTQVSLTTVAQASVDYTVKITNVKDSSGNVLDAAVSKTFKGLLIDDTPPKLATAGSTSNTTINVSFSEPVQGGQESAENPAHYTIVRNNVGASLTTQSIVIVKTAVLNPDKTSVTLTTFPQSALQYTLTVSEVKDLAGNQVSPKDRLTGQANEAKFTGIGETGAGVDTDGDGLSDALEQKGWIVTVKNDGTTIDGGVQEVTSDPTLADTDNDGLNDFLEKNQLTNPRSADTDTDEITDHDEYWHSGSAATDRDSDGDGLLDGLEYTFYRTNPNLKDTDADGLLDNIEVQINNVSPRAILSDLPRFDTNIGSVALNLDVRFNETKGNTTTKGDRVSTQETTLKSTTESATKQNSYAQNWFAKAGTEICWGGACSSGGQTVIDTIATFGAKFTAEIGTGGESSFVSTNETAQMVQNEYAKTLESNKEVSAETVVTREVFGASMKVTATFNSQSNVGFNLKGLTLTAKVTDPKDATKFITIGELAPAGDAVIALGPKGGPQASKTLVFEMANPIPSQIERLMQNPSSIIVELSNYTTEINDERQFVFALADIANQTAQIEIDFGGRRLIEKLNPATFGGFEKSDGGRGAARGITMKYFMEKILELEHVAATPSADGLSCTETTAVDKLENSYSTCLITAGAVKTEALWRIRDVTRKVENGEQTTSWWVLTPTNGLITPVPELVGAPFAGKDFGSYIIRAGETYAFKFVVDSDKDFLEAT